MAIVSGQGHFATLEEHDLWLVAISVVTFTTLGLYLFVVATGMGTVFTTDQEQRHQRVKLAAAAFYFQVFSVIVFAMLMTAATFMNIQDSRPKNSNTPLSSLSSQH